jgi:flagellar biosynthetic protein FliR
VAISALVESFNLLPVSAAPFAAGGFLVLLKSAAMIFSVGLMLALPVIAALLITNIALGVLTRIAPTLNLFAVGFPITLGAGFIVLALTLPLMGSAFASLYDRGFSALGEVMRAGAATP